MTPDLIAVDTNVLIYLHDSSDARKRKIAENILVDNPNIPSQVVSEYINVTRRLLNLSKADVLTQCANLFQNCEIIPVSTDTLVMSAGLIDKYGFQIFDSIIVAAALTANCSILYSEDMQHGLIVDKMTILNPFA